MLPFGVTRPLIAMLNFELNGRHFADNIFKMLFINENHHIFIQVLLNFVHECPANKTSGMVQKISWQQRGD